MLAFTAELRKLSTIYVLEFYIYMIGECETEYLLAVFGTWQLSYKEMDVEG